MPWAVAGGVGGGGRVEVEVEGLGEGEEVVGLEGFLEGGEAVEEVEEGGGSSRPRFIAAVAETAIESQQRKARLEGSDGRGLDSGYSG